ncbi:MAG: hypothetical protein KDC46_09810, partial [Thermoleophilia bacterium]|nr:hypothetical protein [Thermoleophilia bacterium]
MHTRPLLAATCVAATSAVLVVAGAGVASAASSGAGSGGAHRAQSAQQQRPGQTSTRRPSRRAAAPPYLRAAARYLHMRPAALLRQLRQGRSLEAIANTRSADIDGLKEAIVADLQGRLDAQVQAGRLDQSAADAKLADLSGRIDQIVSRPLQAAQGQRPQQRPGQGGQAG